MLHHAHNFGRLARAIGQTKVHKTKTPTTKTSIDKEVFRGWECSYMYQGRKSRKDWKRERHNRKVKLRVLGQEGFQPLDSVQSLSRVRLFATPWTAAHQASLSITNSRSLFKLMSIKLVMPSNHLILCCPLLLPPSIFPSIRVLFQWVISSHEVVKALEFQL